MKPTIQQVTTTQNNQGTEGAQPRITMGETHGRHKVPTKRNNHSSGLK